MLISSIVSIVCIFIVCIYIKNIFTDFSSEANKAKEIIGEQVILKGDTLMIMDYSSFGNTYKLEDGREVSFELVKKLKKIK